MYFKADCKSTISPMCLHSSINSSVFPDDITSSRSLSIVLKKYLQTALSTLRSTHSTSNQSEILNYVQIHNILNVHLISMRKCEMDKLQGRYYDTRKN